VTIDVLEEETPALHHCHIDAGAEHRTRAERPALLAREDSDVPDSHIFRGTD